MSSIFCEPGWFQTPAAGWTVSCSDSCLFWAGWPVCWWQAPPCPPTTNCGWCAGKPCIRSFNAELTSAPELNYPSVPGRWLCKPQYLSPAGTAAHPSQPPRRSGLWQPDNGISGHALPQCRVEETGGDSIHHGLQQVVGPAVVVTALLQPTWHNFTQEPIEPRD